MTQWHSRQSVQGQVENIHPHGKAEGAFDLSVSAVYSEIAPARPGHFDPITGNGEPPSGAELQLEEIWIGEHDPELVPTDFLYKIFCEDAALEIYAALERDAEREQEF